MNRVRARVTGTAMPTTRPLRQPIASEMRSDHGAASRSAGARPARSTSPARSRRSCASRRRGPRRAGAAGRRSSSFSQHRARPARVAFAPGPLGEGDGDRRVLAARPGCPAVAAGGPGEKKTASVASSGPSMTRATLRHVDGPALVRRRPRPGRPPPRCGRAGRPRPGSRGCRGRRCPADWRTEAACRAPVSCIQLTPGGGHAVGVRLHADDPRLAADELGPARLGHLARAPGRARRRAGRSRSLDQPSPHRVRVRKGTSSIECSSTIGGMDAPRAGSSSWPTAARRP